MPTDPPTPAPHAFEDVPREPMPKMMPPSDEDEEDGPPTRRVPRAACRVRRAMT